MDFGFRIHAAMLQFLMIWKQSKNIFLEGQSNSELFFFHGKILLLHLFHWNIEVKWESWKLARLLLIETYLQGCFTAYNFLYSQTIRRQCLVWTLQSRQVMDITGTYWQHSHHSHPSQVLVSLVFWQSRHVLAIRVPLSGEPSSDLWFIECQGARSGCWEMLENIWVSWCRHHSRGPTTVVMMTPEEEGGGEGGREGGSSSQVTTSGTLQPQSVQCKGK